MGYKLYTEEKDSLLVYSVNENEQIVFKTLCSKMMITNEMDMEQRRI